MTDGRTPSTLGTFSTSNAVHLTQAGQVNGGKSTHTHTHTHVHVRSRWRYKDSLSEFMD